MFKRFGFLSDKAEEGGGEIEINKQHARGKLTARERIEILFDNDSFTETDKFVRHFNPDFGMDKKRFYGDGVVAGYGYIEGRLVYVFAQDFTVVAGTLSRSNANKIIKVMEMAYKNRAPIIGIKDSGGARIQEGVDSMAGYTDIFNLNVKLSGVVPQISLILGPCAGGAVYSPALTDFIIMAKEHSYMFLTGPDAIRAVLSEEIEKEDLGGARLHSTRSGVAHLMSEDEPGALKLTRRLLQYLPSSTYSYPPEIICSDPVSRENPDILKIIPPDFQLPYDVKDLIEEVFDKASFFEIQPLFAQNIVVGFAHLGGEAVGIVANQPLYLAGVIDIDASVKAARFIRSCDAFNLPVISLVDVPGFLPGIDQEFDGIIRHGAKLMYAYSEATVPLITLISRKAFGGGYCVMGSKHLNADLNLAFPNAEIAVMGPQAAVDILFRGATEEESHKHKQEYSSIFCNPFIAAEKGYIDEVIDPADTRKVLYKHLKMLKNRRAAIISRKHGNIPL